MSILLELWALLKLVATVFVLPFYAMLVLGILAFSYKDYVEQFYYLIIFIIMVADVVFDILLIMASYKKSICLFKFYFVYGIVYAVSLPVIFLSWVSYAILVRDLDWRNDHVKNNLLITSSVLASVLFVHVYALFLIKKEINKLKVGHEFQFVKQISASRNSLLPSKTEQEV